MENRGGGEGSVLRAEGTGTRHLRAGESSCRRCYVADPTNRGGKKPEQQRDQKRDRASGTDHEQGLDLPPCPPPPQGVPQWLPLCEPPWLPLWLPLWEPQWLPLWLPLCEPQW